MHYDPVTPVNNILNNIEYYIEYGNVKNCPYSHPQAIWKAYTILNKTGKFWESIKYWNHLPPTQKTWIAFKTHFCEAHLEPTKTGELTLEEAGYRQANIVEDIVIQLSSEFNHQENMVNRYPPEDPAPQIAGTADLLQQVLTQNQEHMRLLSAKYGKSVRNNTNRPPNTSTRTCQGQPCHPMPAYFDKYCWTHGQGIYCWNLIPDSLD